MAFSGITIPVGRKTAITACQKTTYEKRGVNKLMNKQNKIEIHIRFRRPDVAFRVCGHIPWRKEKRHGLISETTYRNKRITITTFTIHNENHMYGDDWKKLKSETRRIK